MLKNIIAIFLFVTLFRYFILPTSENFTTSKMKNYKKMLKDNCSRNKTITNKIKKMNAARCDPKRKGKTERDTINNKRLCYDDIYKEIVSELDTESNCVMSKLNTDSKSKAKAKNKSKNKFKSKVKNETSDKIEEGPEFINQFYLLTRDTKKADNLSDINFGALLTNKFSAKGSYDNVSFTSDPSFLYQLSRNKA